MSRGLFTDERGSLTTGGGLAALALAAGVVGLGALAYRALEQRQQAQMVQQMAQPFTQAAQVVADVMTTAAHGAQP